MLNKILLTIGSALTVALTSFGIWSARALVVLEPVCYFDEAVGFNSFNYADTYALLTVGIAIGISIMVVFDQLRD